MDTTLAVLTSIPHRPPDWPWQLAKYAQERRMRQTRAFGSAHVSVAKRFATELDAAADEWQQFRIANKYPALFQAWLTYHAMTSRRLRWELEARLLAAESHQDIANKTGHSPAAIEQYAAVFFDVAGKPDGYISDVVIGEAAKRAVSEREQDFGWKFCGCCYGPIALDLLIYGFHRPTKPDSLQALSASLENDIREQLLLKARLAAHVMQINGLSPTAVVKLCSEIMEMKKRGDASGDVNELMKAGIQGVLESLPWTRDAAANRWQTSANGAELRADELLLTAAGQRPANLDPLLASAVYPPRTQQTTVSN